MTRPRQPDADDARDDECRAQPGRGDAGPVVNPSDIEDTGEFGPSQSLPIPSPGIPVSADEYDRLKEQAKTRRDRHEAPAQEDRPPTPTDR